ncbi:uncharacterized protein LOC127080398 [Lathyrus oleraceus]|uniref:uncharacterized protein LOC127080398 n=1 Tax=Pisum sativum TaxID=3888 RepID=UPI0021CF6871|nr:uncharacterized protein LOC127080398 [Pisum sativum]
MECKGAVLSHVLVDTGSSLNVLPKKVLFVKIPAKKAFVEASSSVAKKLSTKVSRKPAIAQKRKGEEEQEKDHVPNEESGDESPELIPPPQKKKKLTKVSSQRSIVKSTRKDSASTPTTKLQSKDTESGRSSFNTEIPEEQVDVEKTSERILEETVPEEDNPASDPVRQIVADFDATVGETSEDDSPPHPGLDAATHGDDADMEARVEDDHEDEATKNGDDQSKHTEVEQTLERNIPPAPGQTQGSGKSTDSSQSSSTTSGATSEAPSLGNILTKIKMKILDVDLFKILEENSLAHLELKKLLKQVNVLEASAEVGSFVMELMTLIDLATADLLCQRDLTNQISSKSETQTAEWDAVSTSTNKVSRLQKLSETYVKEVAACDDNIQKLEKQIAALQEKISQEKKRKASIQQPRQNEIDDELRVVRNDYIRGAGERLEVSLAQEVEERARKEAEERAKIEVEERARIEVEDKVFAEAATVETEAKAKVGGEEVAHIAVEEVGKTSEVSLTLCESSTSDLAPLLLKTLEELQKEQQLDISKQGKLNQYLRNKQINLRNPVPLFHQKSKFLSSSKRERHDNVQQTFVTGNVIPPSMNVQAQSQHVRNPDENPVIQENLIV